jgi:hypothetical protein
VQETSAAPLILKEPETSPEKAIVRASFQVDAVDALPFNAPTKVVEVIEVNPVKVVGIEALADVPPAVIDKALSLQLTDVA